MARPPSHFIAFTAGELFWRRFCLRDPSSSTFPVSAALCHIIRESSVDSSRRDHVTHRAGGRSRRALVSSLIFQTPLTSQTQTPARTPEFLKQRAEDFQKRSITAEADGLAEPSRASRRTDRSRPACCAVRSTGVSTEPVRKATEAFLAALTPAQREKTVYDINDPEWRKWMNQDFYVRQGVSFLEMTEAQREVAIDLLRAALSAKGLKQTRDIMRLNHTLGELNDNDFDRYGEWRYYLTVMGTPSATEPWGWQLDGHHDDHQLLRPRRSGRHVAGLCRFGAGRRQIRQVQGHDGSSGRAESRRGTGQRADGRTARRRQSSRVSKTGNDNLDRSLEGQRRSRLHRSASVRDDRSRSARSCSNSPRSTSTTWTTGHARVKMDEVRRHLNDTWFAWIGSTDPDGIFYYRVQSPVVLIEFDHQVPINLKQLAKDPDAPTREHIHTVDSDAERQRLRQGISLRLHYQQHPHNTAF